MRFLSGLYAALAAALLFAAPVQAQARSWSEPYQPFPILDVSLVQGPEFDMAANWSPRGTMIITVRPDCPFCWDALKGAFLWLGGVDPEHKPALWALVTQGADWPWQRLGAFLGGAVFLQTTDRELVDKLGVDMFPIIVVADRFGRVYKLYEGYSADLADAWTKDLLGIRATGERLERRFGR